MQEKLRKLPVGSRIRVDNENELDLIYDVFKKENPCVLTMG